MAVLLFLLACIAALMSGVLFAASASAMHEILAAVVGLAAAVLLGCACIVDAVNTVADRLKPQKADSEAKSKYVPCPYCADPIAPDARVCGGCERTPPWAESYVSKTTEPTGA